MSEQIIYIRAIKENNSDLKYYVTNITNNINSFCNYFQTVNNLLNEQLTVGMEQTLVILEQTC